MTSVLIAGATGLVGGRVLAMALADDAIVRVVAPTRCPLPAHAKLVNPIVDFDALPAEADWWAVDGVVGALGTTRAAAGSATAFRRVDHDYALAVARLVREAGADRFALTSSMGADARSRLLYPRTKGEVEAAVRGLDFPSLTIVRPGLLGGNRAEFRVGERIAGAVLRIAAPVLPLRYRISAVDAVARALIHGAIAGPPGITILEPEHFAAA